MNIYGKRSVEKYLKKYSYENIKNEIGIKQFTYIVFDHNEACVPYNLCVFHAAKLADMEVLNTIPEEDYIELLCPKCNRIYIYKIEDIESLHCDECNKSSPLNLLVDEIWKHGYIVISLDTYKKEIIYECPVCGTVMSMRLTDPQDFSCKICSLYEKAKQYGFIVSKNISTKQNEILEDDEIYLICNKCNSVIKIKIHEMNFKEELKNLECPYCKLIKSAHKKDLIMMKDSGTLKLIEDRGEGWYPFVCNICGSIQYIYLEPIVTFNNLEKTLSKIRRFECLNIKSGSCKPPNVIQHMNEDNVIWFADVYNLFSAMPLLTFNDIDFGNVGRFSFPNEEVYNSYVGVDFTDGKQIFYLFVDFTNNNTVNLWSSRFMFAVFSDEKIIKKNGFKISLEALWPKCYLDLKQRIEEQITFNENRNASKKLFFAYEKYIDLIFHIQREAKNYYENAEEISRHLRLAYAIYESKTNQEFPNKFNVDKRLSTYLENAKCDKCNALNHMYSEHCWKCGRNLLD